MIIHGLNFLKAFNMITDIPTKDDFYSSADDMVNEAWGKITDLTIEFYNIKKNDINCESSSKVDLENVWGVNDYWYHHRPKLISALTLILQSVEFRLKGLIAEISPYLLLASSSKQIPKADENGIRSFSQFRSIDAQDLVGVYETFSEHNLSSKFKEWFRESRVMRNKFMHTVDKNSQINPELIFKYIVYAHNELNKNDDHWAWHRYRYKVKHASDGLRIPLMYQFPDEAVEMIQIHFEIAAAVSMCSKEIACEIFNFNKDFDGAYCEECLSVMRKYDGFHDSYIANFLRTVQINKKSKNYQCIFCKEKYDVLPTSIWNDE